MNNFKPMKNHERNSAYFLMAAFIKLGIKWVFKVNNSHERDVG